MKQKTGPKLEGHVGSSQALNFFSQDEVCPDGNDPSRKGKCSDSREWENDPAVSPCRWEGVHKWKEVGFRSDELCVLPSNRLLCWRGRLVGQFGAGACVNSLNCLYFPWNKKSEHAGDLKERSSETIAKEQEKITDLATVVGFRGDLGAPLQYSNPVLGIYRESGLRSKGSGSARWPQQVVVMLILTLHRSQLQSRKWLNLPITKQVSG